MAWPIWLWKSMYSMDLKLINNKRLNVFKKSISYLPGITLYLPKLLCTSWFCISRAHNCQYFCTFLIKKDHTTKERTQFMLKPMLLLSAAHSHSCFELSTERQPKPAIKYPHTASACCYSWASPASVGRQSIWQPRHTITERTGYIQNVDHFFQSPQSTRCSNRWIKQLLCLPKTRKSIHDYFILLLGILTRSDKQILFLHAPNSKFQFY